MTYVFALSTALKSRICEPLCAQSNKICIGYLPESNSRHERFPKKQHEEKDRESKLGKLFMFLSREQSIHSAKNHLADTCLH